MAEPEDVVFEKRCVVEAYLETKELQEAVKSTKSKKQSPPLQGIAIAGMFWWWGSIMFYAPNYLNIASEWHWPFTAVGIICISISFGGALIEIGEAWKNEGISAWAVGAVFSVPAIFLYFAASSHRFIAPWDAVAKTATLALAAFGGAFLIYGMPYFFWKQKDKEPQSLQMPKLSAEELNERRAKKRGADLNAMVSLLVALLSLAAALVKFVSETTK